MRRVPCGLRGRPSFLALLLFLVGGAGTSWQGVATGDDPIGIGEYRDTRPTIDLIDSVRVLSADKAGELEDETKSAYTKLAPTVVRIWTHNDQGEAFDVHGLAVAGSYSGVIIDRTGLILTCSHHGLAPETAVTIELANGKRVPGKTLGRFQLGDPKPKNFGPDIGLAKISESNDWPAANLDDAVQPVPGQICLAIGYPGTLRPGRPPLLRVGRIIPSFPGWPWIEATTTGIGGDSGGPLFDLRGRVLGVFHGLDTVVKYQSIIPMTEFRDRLVAGEIVWAPKPGVRALRARSPQPAAFNPALDLEDRVLQMHGSVIRIMEGTHEVAAGLIVDADGWAVTKASLIGSRQQWSCRVFFTRDGKMIVKGRVAATSAEYDLALLKLDGRGWPVARWASKRPVVGTFVSTILGWTAGPLQFAIVGAEACPEFARALEIPQIPISVQSNAAGVPTVTGAGWSTAEFDAYRELFEPGDVVTHLNGIATPTFADFGRVMDHLHYAPEANGEGVDYNTPVPGSFAGDWVSVGIRRGAVKSTVRIPRIHSTTMSALEWHSHPLSLRRESFPTVFAHDYSLRPEECGGPVVDLAGNVVGLNIARADATRTLAIPADVLQTIIKELRRRAKDAAN